MKSHTFDKITADRSTQDMMFTRLVDNALDFLSKAVDDLENSPKYSMIHFHAAVELFIKARLMAEHWTLVVSKRQEPDWSKFVSGDFQSVTLEDAAGRLDKAANSGLSKKQLSVFREVTKHRNKTVHFFHEAHTEQEADELRQSIVRQQLNAWYSLHGLLTDQWEDVFLKWADEITEIDRKLRSLHDFLTVVFENLQPEMQVQAARGVEFEVCPSCGFLSNAHDSEQDAIYDSDCLVCGFIQRALRIRCFGCESEVLFEGEGFSSCTQCGRQYEPEQVVGILLDEGAVHLAVKDGDDSWDLGNCSDCDSYHTAVRLGDEDYFCANCFDRFDTLETCGWCNEPNTGNMESSYWAGCNCCDGKAGWTIGD